MPKGFRVVLPSQRYIHSDARSHGTVNSTGFQSKHNLSSTIQKFRAMDMP